MIVSDNETSCGGGSSGTAELPLHSFLICRKSQSNQNFIRLPRELLLTVARDACLDTIEKLKEYGVIMTENPFFFRFFFE